MDYKSTLNMPKSGFPMRAGLPKREPEMLKHWEEMDLYNLMLKKNEGKPRFALHDGPPFSNGGLHMGHALNKSLKDFITRSYAMRGYYTPYIPGWDNHGMPIESAIIKEQKLNHISTTRPILVSKPPSTWSRTAPSPTATRPCTKTLSTIGSPRTHTKTLSKAAQPDSAGRHHYAQYHGSMPFGGYALERRLLE